MSEDAASKRRPVLVEELGPAQPEVKVERIPRSCLRCDKRFIAPNRFTRLCNTCRGYVRELDWPGALD